jgi:putative ABC transport system substrate-binding protein
MTFLRMVIPTYFLLEHDLSSLRPSTARRWDAGWSLQDINPTGYAERRHRPGDATMRRRDFHLLLVGATAAGLQVAHSQQQLRRIAIITVSASDEPVTQARLAALKQGLQQYGWTDTGNVAVDYRAAAGSPEKLRQHVNELASLAPDVIVAIGSEAVTLLQQATRVVPIVFTDVPDPIGAGFVDGMARPGRNATGFMLFEFGMSGKWLELLKEIAPNVTRVAVLRDPSMTAGVGQFAAIQALAPSLRIDLRPIDVRDADEIERGLSTFSDAGMIVTSSPSSQRHRDLIIGLAARHRLPAVYGFSYYAAAGGLIAYGPDPMDPLRRAAGYVDRILKGEKPADLPVQAPTKYQLVINLKTAKALGLTVSPLLLARADEVIE